MIGTFVLVWRMTLHVSRSVRAAWIAAVLTLSFPPLVHLGLVAFRPKIFVCLFGLAAVSFAMKRRPAAAGLAAGLTFLTWQPALLVGAAIWAPLARDREWRGLMASLLAAFACVVAYEGYFWSKGALGEQLLQAYWYPATTLPLGLADRVGELPRLYKSWVKSWGYFHPLPLVVAYELGRYWASRTVARRPESLVYTVAALALAFTLYDHQGKGDLLFPLPYAAIVAALAIDRWIERVRISERTAAGLVVAALAVPLLLGINRFATSYSLEEQRHLAAQLREWNAAGETIYAINCPHLLGLAGLRNWSQYGFFDTRMTPMIALDSNRPQLEPAIDGQWPSLVLQSRHLPHAMQAWLAKRYTPVEAATFAAQGIDVYRLR